ncbi:MAG: hypothetical protein J7J07_01870 [Syntrophobacterales bacterium]|nr:hypothetical protein [Syntrophobacterales bacterium]
MFDSLISVAGARDWLRAGSQSIFTQESILMGFSILEFIQRIFSDFHAMHREDAVALTIVEMEELENIFALLLLGSFVGFPSPPTFLAIELLPFMGEELNILNRRAEDAGDMLAEMCGTIGID